MIRPGGQPLGLRPTERELTERTAWELAVHLICAHKNIASVWNGYEDNLGIHEHEHDGPGTIRNHRRDGIFFSAAEVEAVLEEAEREEGMAPPFGWEPAGHLVAHLPGEGLLSSLASPVRVVTLTTGNFRSVQEWLASHGIGSEWNDDPPRLIYGGSLGSYSSPPGYRITVRRTGSGWGAAGMSEGEWLGMRPVVMAPGTGDSWGFC